MSEINLPEVWAARIAAECFDQISTNGIKVKTKECQESGLYPVIDQGQEFISGFIDDNEKLIKLENPVIVFGDHTRNIKWVDFDFVPGADGTKILSPKEYLFPRLAFYGLKNLEIPDKGYSRHFKFLKELEIPLPPLAEQKVIADKLDTLLAQVETTKARLDRIPKILKSFRQSVLAAAVSGKLTVEWREDRKPISPCFNTILERKESLIKSKAIKKDLTAQEVSPPETYVNGWLYLKLKSLASKITDGEHKTPKREENGRYLLSARNIQHGFITVSNVDYVGEEEYQKLRKRCDPNKGDLLISCSGSVGRVCLVDNDDMYVMVRSAALVRTIEDFVNEKYLMYFLQSPDSQKNIEESSKSTAQSNLFLGPIKDLEIALPSIEEQSEIVRRVEELFAFADTIEQKAAAALERVNNLTQSILAKAFRGELTADWRAANPDLISGENSAEALLAKIQAEREDLKPVKKTRKKKA